jgi:protein ImuB
LLPGGERRSVDFWDDAMLPVCASPAKQAVLQRSRIIRLVERLRVRLGPESVHGLNLVAEHRPEYAWRSAEPCSSASTQKMLGELITRLRPLWLLARPRRLNTIQGMPVCRGKLVFVSNAERIESGWWDGNDVRRDYYRVADQHGKYLWVYQDRRSAGWYLHGLFA